MMMMLLMPTISLLSPVMPQLQLALSPVYLALFLFTSLRRERKLQQLLLQQQLLPLHTPPSPLLQHPPQAVSLVQQPLQAVALPAAPHVRTVLITPGLTSTWVSY